MIRLYLNISFFIITFYYVKTIVKTIPIWWKKRTQKSTARGLIQREYRQ